MELTINRNTLAEALNLAMPYANAKNPIAILKYGKMTTKGNRIKLEANDSQGGIVRYMTLTENCDEDGSFLINVADVSKFVSKLKDAELRIKVADSTLTIKHSKGASDFPSPDAVEYPSLASDETGETLTLPTAYLAESIRLAKDFVSTDNLRPQMTAIYAYFGEGKYGVCATDTHVLIHNEYDLAEAQGEEKGFLIMPNAFGAIVSACKDSENVTITFNDKQAQYHFGSTIVRSTLAKGRFPMFRRVIPQSHKIECVIEKSDILETVGRALLFVNNTSCIKLAFSQMDLTTSVENLTEAKKSSETIPHNGCDGELTIGMNANNFAKCIKAIPSGEVKIEMNDENHAMVFRCDAMPNMTILSMPMSLVS